MSKLNRIYKNWFVHNCFGHPLMYFIGAILSEELGMAIHDITLPDERKDDGRTM